MFKNLEDQLVPDFIAGDILVSLDMGRNGEYLPRFVEVLSRTSERIYRVCNWKRVPAANLPGAWMLGERYTHKDPYASDWLNIWGEGVQHLRWGGKYGWSCLPDENELMIEGTWGHYPRFTRTQFDQNDGFRAGNFKLLTDLSTVFDKGIPSE